MSYLTKDDRQSILNRVYTHFIVNRQPAGHLCGASCIYHGIDDSGRRVSCAIGIFDTEGQLDREPLRYLSIRQLIDQEPGALADVFSLSDLDDLDVGFLTNVQEEHDLSTQHAVLSEQDFDALFIEELAHRLNRFAGEQDLISPCAPSDLGAG